MKCPKSSDGKHKWTNRMVKDILGYETQHRKCDHCKLDQLHRKNPITGRSEGWQTTQGNSVDRVKRTLGGTAYNLARIWTYFTEKYFHLK